MCGSLTQNDRKWQGAYLLKGPSEFVSSKAIVGFNCLPLWPITLLNVKWYDEILNEI